MGEGLYCTPIEKSVLFVYAVVFNVYFDKKLPGGSCSFLQLSKLACTDFALTP